MAQTPTPPRPSESPPEAPDWLLMFAEDLYRAGASPSELALGEWLLVAHARRAERERAA